MIAMRQIQTEGGGWKTLGILLSAIMLILIAGCGGSGFADSADGLGGTIEIDGSSTVFPISEAVAEEFGKVHKRVRVNVGVSGTGGGFKRFVRGEIDIADASRPIKESEAAEAMENGIEYIELEVGTDGLSVMVSLKNDFVDCLTINELKMIWEPEEFKQDPNSKVRRWNDVRPDWPDRSIHLYGPDTDSGTFDYFTEEVVGQARASRPDYTASASDDILVQGVAGDRNSLGYFGYAFYIENADKLKLIAVDSGQGCVLPTDETIESGEYSTLSRPLLIYVNEDSLKQPEVLAFVEFYMEQAPLLVREVGYVPEKPEIYQDNLTIIRQTVASGNGTAMEPEEG